MKGSPTRGLRGNQPGRDLPDVDMGSRRCVRDGFLESQERNALAAQVRDQRFPRVAVRVYGHVERVPMVEPQAVVDECLAPTRSRAAPVRTARQRTSRCPPRFRRRAPPYPGSGSPWTSRRPPLARREASSPPRSPRASRPSAHRPRPCAGAFRPPGRGRPGRARRVLPRPDGRRDRDRAARGGSEPAPPRAPPPPSETRLRARGSPGILACARSGPSAPGSARTPPPPPARSRPPPRQGRRAARARRAPTPSPMGRYQPRAESWRIASATASGFS